jgi:penicillin-binding protein 2
MSDTTSLRLSALAIVALSLLGALTARLWFLTAVEGEEAVVAADANRIRTIHIQAPRGRILDREQRVLVDNAQVRQVRVDQTALDEAVRFDDDARDAVLERLADELTRFGIATTLDDIHEALEQQARRTGPYLPTPVVEGVPEDLEVLLAENHLQFPGIDVERVARRAYPHDALAAHVLGYVGSISQEELDANQNPDKPYEPGDDIGKTGIELAYEPWLRGVPGERVLEVDAQGEVVREVSYHAPEPGMDVVLTLDLQVQTLLEQQLTAATETHDAAGAAGVVEDPRDGSILAMASLPTFHPQEFSGGISQRRYEELTAEGSGFPLVNKVISGEYAPGSTFKPVTALAGLRAGVIAPSESFYDDGRYEVVGCEENPTCWFNNAGEIENGSVNLELSLTKSSDWYYYRVGDNLWGRREAIGDDFLQQTAHEFGFTNDTGIDLPSERDGFAFTPEILSQLHDENPEAFPYDDWVTGYTVNMAIGQGDLGVTPMQLTNMYAAIANGGTLYRPHLTHEVWEPHPEIGPEGEWYVDHDAPCEEHTGERCAVMPEEIGSVNIRPRWRSPILQGLLGVPGGNGTAASAFEGFDLAGFPIAGKTGTAQVTGQGDFAWFTGFGPVLPGQQPQYVVTVLLEAVGQFGGEVSAPVVRAVFDGLRDPMLLPAVPADQATPVPSTPGDTDR